MTKINQTLLNKLFIQPNPQPKNKAVSEYYDQFRSRMFPNEDDYISFLTSQSIDRQYECAELIIQRLCYQSNFPPSYYALMDVVCVEHYQKNGIQNTDGYIPRDHFLHIVFLYLLGIYVFFYNSEFYSRIVTNNKFQRDGRSIGNIECACIKDFISEWKYFCLFHDVGYTAEILGNKCYKKQKRMQIQKALKKNAGGYKASFGKNETQKQLAFWSTIEIISKLVFAKMVLDNSETRMTRDHKVFKYFKEAILCHNADKTDEVSQISFDEIPKSCLTGCLLDRVFSNHCLKRLIPVLDSDNITVLGTDKKTGHLGFISYVNEKKTREFVFTENIKKCDEFEDFLRTPDIILFDDYIPTHFSFQYLFVGDCEFDNLLKILEIKHLFDSASSLVRDSYENNSNGITYENKFKGITDESQFLDFSFLLFKSMCKQIGENYYNTDLEKILDNQVIGSEKKEDQIKDESLRNKMITRNILSLYQGDLLDSCNALLFNKIKELYDKKKPSKRGTKLSTMVKNHVNCYFESVEEASSPKETMIRIFCDQLERTITEKIEKERNLILLFSRLYIQVKGSLSKCRGLFEYNYEKAKMKKSPFLEECISGRLSSLMKMTIRDVMSDYSLEHGISTDHGIASANYAAGIFDCYSSAIEKAKKPQERLLLAILLDMSGNWKESKVGYVSNYNHIFRSVLYAIFSHNLYPSHFKENSSGRQYKTKINDTLSYLALLCDNLQDWNRPKSLHPALMEKSPIIYASEEYNIDVSNAGIILSDIATKSDNWIKEKIMGLSEYLSDVSAYVKRA